MTSGAAARSGPGDIIAAALATFAEVGLRRRLDEEIARRAGLSKGTLYLYFETKEDMFRAVVREVVVPNIEGVEKAVFAVSLPFAAMVRTLLPRLPRMQNVSGRRGRQDGDRGLRNFPELARVWHDEVIFKAIGLIAGVVERARRRARSAPAIRATNAGSWGR